MSRNGRKFGHRAELVKWRGKARIQCVCGAQSPIFKDKEEETEEGEVIIVPKEEQAHEWFVYEHTRLIEVRKEYSDA